MGHPSFNIPYTGWTMNHGLLFAGPPPPPLGGCERKDQSNPLGGRPSNTIHMGVAVGGRPLRCYIAGRQLIAKSFAQDRPFMKICTGPSASWSLGLEMKKLLDDGLDLMSWPRGGKKLCKQNEWRIYATDCGFRRRTCQHRHLPRAFETAVVPWVQRDIALQKVRLSANSVPACITKTTRRL